MRPKRISAAEDTFRTVSRFDELREAFARQLPALALRDPSTPPPIANNGQFESVRLVDDTHQPLEAQPELDNKTD